MENVEEYKRHLCRTHTVKKWDMWLWRSDDNRSRFLISFFGLKEFEATTLSAFAPEWNLQAKMSNNHQKGSQPRVATKSHQEAGRMKDVYPCAMSNYTQPSVLRKVVDGTTGKLTHLVELHSKVMQPTVSRIPIKTLNNPPSYFDSVRTVCRCKARVYWRLARSHVWEWTIPDEIWPKLHFLSEVTLHRIGTSITVGCRAVDTIPRGKMKHQLSVPWSVLTLAGSHRVIISSKLVNDRRIVVNRGNLLIHAMYDRNGSKRKSLKINLYETAGESEKIIIH